MTLPLAAVALAAIFAGTRVRDGISTKACRGWLRKGLWAIAALLVIQFAAGRY